MRTHVLPEAGRWVARQQTPMQAFGYDVRHFGLRVALHNLLWLWVHRHDGHVEAR